MESRLNICVRIWSSEVASHCPSWLIAMREILTTSGVDSNMSSESLSSAPVSTSISPVSFFCLPLTTRLWTTESCSRCWAKRLSTRGASPVRSSTRTKDDTVVITSFEESGEKRKVMAPVEGIVEDVDIQGCRIAVRSRILLGRR